MPAGSGRLDGTVVLPDREGTKPRSSAYDEDAVAARTVHGGILLVAVAVAIQSGAHILNVVALDNYWDVLNADSDTGAPAWASSALQSAAAVLVLLLAARFRARQWWLLGLAGLLAFLSLDDLITIHERVSRLALTLDLWAHAGRLVWPIVFLPLLAATFVGLWWIGDAPGGELERGGRADDAQLLIRLGLALLVAAVVLEIAAQGLFVLDVGRLDAPFVAEVLIEEGAELAGWGLIVTGLAARVLARA